jgi:hypothetical protein
VGNIPFSTIVQKSGSKEKRERKAKRTDFISSATHVCTMRENEINEIKRHHTKKAFQF